MKKIFIFIVFTFLLFTFQSKARAQVNEEEDKTKAFKSVIEINDLNLKVPTVLEMEVKDQMDRYEFAVFETKSSSFQPYFFNRIDNSVSVSVKSDVDSCKKLYDKNYSSYCEYPLPQEGKGNVTVTFEGERAFLSSRLSLSLDQFVALPTHVELKADGKIVYKKSKMKFNSLNFPETKARVWEVTFDYIQPLRISEIELVQNSTGQKFNTVRFLARPESDYRIYFNPDRYSEIKIKTGESADLRSDNGVKKIQSYEGEDNIFYEESDVDADGVFDLLDNCIRVANQDQEDIDQNGRGDACDDFDKDGVMNSKDNCPDQPNRGQRDEDGDGFGDECDGEESRVTEKHPWLPFVSLGFVVVVVGFLFTVTLKSKK